MSSRSQISLNFQEAVNYANTLENYANEVDGIAKGQIEDSIGQVRGAWKGTNAELFISKQVQLQGDVKKVAAELKSIAADIKTVAKTIYDTEMRNLEIAEKREAEAAAARAAAERAKENNEWVSNGSIKGITGVTSRIIGNSDAAKGTGRTKNIRDIISGLNGKGFSGGGSGGGGGRGR